ncbi:MAG: hypothetical protein ACU84Q_00545 [Gammaproteobacteria bacterium]
MERIKSALEKAKLERERLHRKSLQRQANLMEISNSDANETHKKAIFSRPPFSNCTSEQKLALIQDGTFVHVNEGDTFQLAGEIDGYVNYLLSGVVAIESDVEPPTEIAAEEGAEVVALDKAGLKTQTITAITDADLFRIVQSSLPNVAQYPGENPLPKNLYTETQSGQDLAELVEKINQENSASESGHTARAPEVTVGENTLGFNFNIEDLPDASMDRDAFATAVTNLAAPNSAPTPDGYEPEIDDEIGRFARQLDHQFRDYVGKVRAEERERYESLLEKHANKLKHAAEDKLREKVKLIRDRYHHAYQQKEHMLQERLTRMREFADQITRQKAAIYEARRGLANKLAQAEKLHNELTNLGNEVNTQLDKLDDLMPDADGMRDAVNNQG